MSYCDFNPRLFKEFTSMKNKVKPAMADDWEILTSSYNTMDGFILESKKLNQRVADIRLRRFLNFCKEQNLVIKGLKLQGNYIVGNDRSVYTEEMFTEWKNKYDTRTETITDKKDAKIGHQYKTPCGRSLIFIGARYVAKIKDKSSDEGIYGEFTAITKKYYVATENNYNGDKKYSVEELKNKLTVDMGKKFQEDVADKLLNDYYIKYQNIVCWESDKPKNPEFGLIEQTFEKRYYSENRSDKAETLFFKNDGVLYSSGKSSLCDMNYYGPEIVPPDPWEQRGDNKDWRKERQRNFYEKSKKLSAGFYTTEYEIVNEDGFIGTIVRRAYSRENKREIKADGLYRIGII